MGAPEQHAITQTQNDKHFHDRTENMGMQDPASRKDVLTMRMPFKTASTVILICCLLCSLFPDGFSLAAQAPLKLMVAADTHFQCAADLGAFSATYTENLLDPAVYGYASTQGQMPYESEAILAQMLEEFAASDAACLLIAGDLTCGKPQSHRAFAEYLKKAEATTGKPVFVINGNHDCDAESSDKGISMQDFCEIYADFGYSEAISRHKDSASYAVDLNGTYRLLAIDSCIYGEDDGRISTSVFRWIKAQTEQASKDGKTLLAMMHHSILPHYELQPMIDNWQFFASWFADHGIRTVLSGHIHANDISSTVSDCGNTLYDIQTGALIASPNTYRLLTFQPDELHVESRFITKIDTSLLPPMLTQQQKALIEADFPSYARAYFDSGVCKWLNRNVGSADRLVRWFKLKEGTKAYAAAQGLSGVLGDAVGLDIYDTGKGESVESVLRPYGISVPQSAYQKPYEVAATLMYGLFHGDEATVSSKADTELLLVCLQGALLSAAQHMPAPKIPDTLAAAEIKKAPAKQSLRAWSEQGALALLETLAGGIVDDYSAPADLNVTLRWTPQADTVTVHPLLRLFRLLAEYFTRRFA